MGRELVLDIDMMRPETLFTELSARANRGVPRYRRAYPLDAVVRLPAVRSLLQTSETENERLLACVAEWDKAQEAIYASLQFLHPRRQGTKYAEWEKCYNAALPVFENKLRDILGETRFERLKQVRRQIAGPQTLLGHEEVPGNPLTKDQRDRIDKARQELGAALHKWVMPVLMTRSYDHLEGLYDGHARASEKAVYGVFTPAQREGWAIMIGEPLDAGLLKSLRTDVGNQLQKLVVRKG
jgi:hypothetical protein